MHRSKLRPQVPVTAILFSCLFAAQSGQLARTPVLTDAARAFGLSTAAAGQIRTGAAAFSALAAIAAGALATRVGLRAVLRAGLALVLAGASRSSTRPSPSTERSSMSVRSRAVPTAL